MRLRPRTATANLGQLTGRWILGFGVMYAFYTWYAFEGLTGECTTVERIVMVLGPLPVALSLLISPALFAAATETRHGSWSSLLLFSLAAYTLSAVGPTVTISLMPTFPDQLSEPMFVSAPDLELGRFFYHSRSQSSRRSSAWQAPVSALSQGGGVPESRKQRGGSRAWP